MHNSVTLNLALSGFEADLDLHYGIANQFHANAFIVGSNTVLTANNEIPKETSLDFFKPHTASDISKPFWIVVDSKGKLNGMLHFYRKMSYIRDIILLVSEETPREYLEYLRSRQYEYIVAGANHVDYQTAFDILCRKYGISTMLIDSGSTLSNILLMQNLVSEISLLIKPEIIGGQNDILFNNIELPENISIELLDFNKEINDTVMLRYKIIKGNPQNTN